MSLLPLRRALQGWSPQAGPARDPVAALALLWPAIVGGEIAANSAPVALTGESLVVATRSSAWSQQLTFLSPAILAAIAREALPASVRRLSFRAGAFRRRERAEVPVRPARLRRRGEEPAGPAADLDEAVERLRSRMRAVRRATDATCVTCAAPLEPGERKRDCTPCRLGAERARLTALERILYSAPWISFEQLREQVPQATPAAFELARRRLLGRWWVALERLRAARRPAISARERALAGSYVLLQSRLPPERVTDAVVRNLLGDELSTLLFGKPP